MTKKLELYRCEICGNIVEVVECGMGELVCCGQPMKMLTAHKSEEDAEKFEHHIPQITEKDDYIEIQIGKEPHPMTPEHYIEFIEVYSKENVKIIRKYLTPGMAPTMKVPKCVEIGRVVAYCNVHGLWELS